MSAWDIGLFDCFSDCKVCLVSMFCAPCQLAYQKAAVEEHPCGFGDLCLTLFFGFCCMVSVRGKIRQKYNFEGGVCGDILTAWCCSVCAVTQQTKQLDQRGAKPAGFCMEK